MVGKVKLIMLLFRIELLIHSNIYRQLQKLCNALTLSQDFGGQMTSSMQIFRHFWLNVHGFRLAGLAPKPRQLTSIRKTQRKHNEMGYLKSILSFDPRSTVLALGVKLYWGQALFFKPYVFLQELS